MRWVASPHTAALMAAGSLGRSLRNPHRQVRRQLARRAAFPPLVSDAGASRVRGARRESGLPAMPRNAREAHPVRAAIQIRISRHRLACIVSLRAGPPRSTVQDSSNSCSILATGQGERREWRLADSIQRRRCCGGSRNRGKMPKNSDGAAAAEQAAQPPASQDASLEAHVRMMAALGLTPAAAQQSGARPRPSILQPLQDPILQLCASAAFQTLVQQQVAGSSVPRHPTGRERMGSPTLQPLQDPILQLCFRGFPTLVLLA
jgi:hypothetical protein